MSKPETQNPRLSKKWKIIGFLVLVAAIAGVGLGYGSSPILQKMQASLQPSPLVTVEPDTQTALQMVQLEVPYPATMASDVLSFGSEWRPSTDNPEDLQVNAPSSSFEIFAPANPAGDLQLVVWGTPLDQAALDVGIQFGASAPFVFRNVTEDSIVLDLPQTALPGPLQITVSDALTGNLTDRWALRQVMVRRRPQVRIVVQDAVAVLAEPAPLATVVPVPTLEQDDVAIVEPEPLAPEEFPEEPVIAAVEPVEQIQTCVAPSIMPASRFLYEPMPLGQRLGIGDPALQPFLNFDNGWWDTEPNGRWIGKSVAHMSFVLPASDAGLKLEMNFDVFDAAARELRIRFDGLALFDGAIPDDGRLVLDVSALPRKREVVLRFVFSTPVLDCPGRLHGNTDTRQLAAMLKDMQLDQATQVVETNRRMPDGSENAFVIARGGGAIDGQPGRNSLEALDANKDNFEFFEVDLTFTFDGQLICLRNWDDAFTDRFGFAAVEPLSQESFTDLLNKTDIEGFTNCTLETLASWMYENRDNRIITRFDGNELSALQEMADALPSIRERFIVQVSDPELIETARSLGFRDVIWRMDNQPGMDPDELARAIARSASGYVMSMEQAKTGMVAQINQSTDAPVYLEGAESAADASCAAVLGASGVFSTTLPQTVDRNAITDCVPS